jgi:hypothetical protein
MASHTHDLRYKVNSSFYTKEAFFNKAFEMGYIYFSELELGESC